MCPAITLVKCPERDLRTRRSSHIHNEDVNLERQIDSKTFCDLFSIPNSSSAEFTGLYPDITPPINVLVIFLLWNRLTQTISCCVLQMWKTNVLCLYLSDHALPSKSSSILSYWLMSTMFLFLFLPALVCLPVLSSKWWPSLSKIIDCFSNCVVNCTGAEAPPAHFYSISP